jgi:CheY-like chemotaxis protein
LVVEDDDLTRDQLVKLLRTTLPGSVIDSAASVEEALARIQSALDAGTPYDLAILDFKLPPRIGEMDKVDESVCQRLTESMPDAIVSHISGYADDTRILGHLGRVHPAGRRQGFFLDKRSSGFAKELIRQSRAALFGAALDRDINELFSSSEAPRPDGEGARSGESRGSGSFSNRSADLCLDIRAAWKDLNASTKAQVQKFFDVVEREGIAVSVVLR